MISSDNNVLTIILPKVCVFYFHTFWFLKYEKTQLCGSGILRVLYCVSVTHKDVKNLLFFSFTYFLRNQVGYKFVCSVLWFLVNSFISILWLCCTLFLADGFASLTYCRGRMAIFRGSEG